MHVRSRYSKADTPDLVETTAMESQGREIWEIANGDLLNGRFECTRLALDSWIMVLGLRDTWKASETFYLRRNNSTDADSGDFSTFQRMKHSHLLAFLCPH
ncbi:hypothetical protein TNCV_3445681 [Trichonephila clavipes]|nr:hypothetical protein TNCV_3445681 [Trichonephila clavipes]